MRLAVYRHVTRDVTKNLSPDEGLARIESLLNGEFHAANLFTTGQSAQLDLGDDREPRLTVGRARIRVAFYSKYILPQLIDLGMKNPAATEWRSHIRAINQPQLSGCASTTQTTRSNRRSLRLRPAQSDCRLATSLISAHV